jgi:hypothetical protein
MLWSYNYCREINTFHILAVYSSIRTSLMAFYRHFVKGWKVSLAQKDYNYWKGKGSLKIWGFNKDERQIVDATVTLIKEHLIEALSSPYPYIREWGKLIAKGVGNGQIIPAQDKVGAI